MQIPYHSVWWIPPLHCCSIAVLSTMHHDDYGSLSASSRGEQEGSLNNVIRHP